MMNFFKTDLFKLKKVELPGSVYVIFVLTILSNLIVTYLALNYLIR